jgi:hypothetical protein
MIMETEPLKCSECGRDIAVGEAVWYRPYAHATPNDGGALSMQSEASESDNGGAPFHKTCLDKRLGEGIPDA